MYCCQMPFCDYVCEDKSQIHSHHIKPKALGGSNDRSNLINLCPNCHDGRIYIPEMSNGNHSIKHNNSVVLLGKLSSTGGPVISYRFVDDDEVRYGILKITDEVTYA